MNYRHAYHAGNFADCVKHALLLVLFRAMQRKDTPFLFLDTHAGMGRYDLSAGPAEKTGEWRDGIARILAAQPPALTDYIQLVERLGLYPGSPAIAAALLRETDRLVACELHPEDARALRAAFAGVKNVSVHERDGYAALKAFLPPPEKRGLILIDPPFEREDEFAICAENISAAWQKFKTGIFFLWYPIKHRAPSRNFLETLKRAAIRDVISLEFLRRPANDPVRLNGCGLLVINPPYGFEAAAEPILSALQGILGQAGGSHAITRLIDE